MSDASDINDRLFAVIQSRRQNADEGSYVASLNAKGLNKILEKIGEEAIETILAAKDAAADREAVIRETADLWFHLLVMLDHLDLTPDQVLAELERRFGTSGIAEKRSQKNRELTMSFGITELVVILAIVLLIFGTGKLKSIGTDLGGAIKGFRSAVTDDSAKQEGEDANLKQVESSEPKS